MQVFIEKKDTISEENCIICFDKLNEYFSDENYILECRQCVKQFHPICIDKWKPGRNNCPYCRYTIIKNNLIRYNSQELYFTNQDSYYYYDDFTFHYHYFPFYIALASLCKMLILIIIVFIIIPIYFILNWR